MFDHVKVNIIQGFIILPHCLPHCQNGDTHRYIVYLNAKMAPLAGKYLKYLKCCQEKIRVFDSKIMVDHVKVNIIQHFIILPNCLSQCQNGDTSR